MKHICLLAILFNILASDFSLVQSQIIETLNKETLSSLGFSISSTEIVLKGLGFNLNID
jgi:hypothetical protein